MFLPLSPVRSAVLGVAESGPEVGDLGGEAHCRFGGLLPAAERDVDLSVARAGSFSGIGQACQREASCRTLASAARRRTAAYSGLGVRRGVGAASGSEQQSAGWFAGTHPSATAARPCSRRSASMRRIASPNAFRPLMPGRRPRGATSWLSGGRCGSFPGGRLRGLGCRCPVTGRRQRGCLRQEAGCSWLLCVRSDALCSPPGGARVGSWP